MKKRIMTLMAGTAMLPAAAFAQATGAADAGPDASSGDIIVTAQRYEQRLQDVPLSISAIGADELAARGTTDLKDLQYSVPGLSTYEYGVSRQFVQLRGLATTIGSSTVGLYLDETPLGLDTQGDPFNVRLYDMERVEVLRGPQATLYGQGSMGGAIRYIPAAPRLDAVGGSFEGEYSSTRYGDSNYKAVGVLNLPIATDKLGVRLVAGYERIGGYIDNVVSGEKNINSADIYVLRGTLLARPTDRLSLSLMGVYQESKQANQDFGVDYRTTALLPQPVNDRYTLFQGKASYDLDTALLSFSTSYIDRHNSGQSDVSAFYLPTLNLIFPPGFIDRVGTATDSDFNIYNGEIRLASQNDGPFGWQVGAIYRDSKFHSVTTTPTAPNPSPIDLVASDVLFRNKSYALYGEVNYAFTPQLKAIVGLRYFDEHKTAHIESVNFGALTTDIGDGSFNSFNPRFNLSYEFSPSSMVFVNVAKGFRSGGFNATSVGPGIPPTYDSDEIWTYELGTKHQLLDGKLTLDASLYRSEWSKVQSYTFVPGSALAAVTNGGHVDGWGVDLSATARPTKALTLTATYGWNNLKFDKATIDKAVGDPVDGAVRESWSASLDYRPQLSADVTGIFRIDYQHAGPSQITLRLFNVPPVIPRPGRDLVNLRIGVGVGPVEVALFANNLFDENAPNLIGPLGTIGENIEQRPRVIGIGANARF
ncbi:TonB-dependent receptor [Sphingopyxis sp. J-6]|uniref:TonB-dependent receptor n=1 Tax=Sphingopyxis sp. J-6 TaxID=3122054 RepID=UPI003983DCD5